MNGQIMKSYEIIAHELQSWWELIIRLLPSLIVALLILSFFLVLARYASRLFEKILARSMHNNQTVMFLLVRVLQVVIISVGVFIALGILKLDKTVSSLLAGAGVFGLVIGFAFQDICTNIIAGILIALRKPFLVGDIISIGENQGTVRSVDLRSTLIRTFENQDLHIPNKRLITDVVINYSSSMRRMIKIPVSVSYDSDLDLVEKVINEALRSLDGCAYPKETSIHFNSFGDSGIELVVRYWIDYPGQSNYLRSVHDAIKKIRKAFDQHKIKIPFPTRTVEYTFHPPELV